MRYLPSHQCLGCACVCATPAALMPALLLSVEATVTGSMHPKGYAPAEDHESSS
jgi:hypothetical protein